MRAVIYSEFGAPSKVLRVAEVGAMPPGENEVSIQVLLANINYNDLAIVRGQYGVLPSLPARVGSEGVGLVLETGPSVNSWIRAGERVCFHDYNGAWGENITVQQRDVVRLPAAVDLYTAAQFFTNPLTAEVLLTSSGAAAGDFILVNAAGSAVGKLLIRFALLKGIIPIAVIRNENTRAQLEDTGIPFVVNGEKENLMSRVRAITKGRGVAVAFDAVAGKGSSEILCTLATHGQLILYGALSKERIPLNVSQVLFNDTTIRCFWLRRWLRQFDGPGESKLKAYLDALAEKLVANNIGLPVEAVYRMEEVQQAVTHFETPGRSGKILINIQ
jgi:NADPH:quinone reductase-like Zn-dependent oxidoreductase